MKNKFKVTFLPSRVSVEVDQGVTLFNAALAAGYTIHTGCGLQGTCGRCRVKVENGTFSAQPSATLTKDDIKKGCCLACTTTVEDHLTVRLREEVCHRRKETIVEAKDEKLPAAHPLVVREKITFTPPAPEENTTDLRIIQKELNLKGFKNVSWDVLPVLKKLPSVCHGDAREINIILHESGDHERIIDLTAVPDENLYGVAIDLGTTTVAARLMDLEKARILCETGNFNQQLLYGDDIIHRIIFAEREGGLEKLRALACGTINDLIENLAAFKKIRPDRIMSAVVSGNTTMAHLLLGLDPKYIRLAPYTPAALQFPPYEAGTLGLSLLPQAPVYLTPGLGSYVGGDISAGLAAADVDKSEALTLYLDLGTNGEIVLGNQEWMVGCACSCGPAFEGSGIRCGMRYAEGAVESIFLGDEPGSLSYRAAGGKPPEGLCGSALIDVMACFHKSGLIDKKGRLKEELDDGRMSFKDQQGDFLLIPAADTGHGQDILITDRDLENLIRTKGAVWAAIATLLKKLEIKKDRIEKVIIAGNFGRTLNISNAITIGMLPHLPPERFTFIGNASLQGASLALLSRDFRARLDKIAQSMTYIDLSTLPGYMDEFIASLFIPHTDASLFPL